MRGIRASTEVESVPVTRIAMVVSKDPRHDELVDHSVIQDVQFVDYPERSPAEIRNFNIKRD